MFKDLHTSNVNVCIDEQNCIFICGWSPIVKTQFIDGLLFTPFTQFKKIFSMYLVVPHITDAIQEWVERVASIPVDGDAKPPECCIIEVGVVTCISFFSKHSMCFRDIKTTALFITNNMK